MMLNLVNFYHSLFVLQIRVSNLCTRKPCWLKCHRFSMIVDACFDHCHCFVYAQPRYYPESRTYWSDKHDFQLGPTGM